MNTRNHYEVLGIRRNATAGEITKGFRKLAMEWHPDKNSHRQELATAKFKEIQSAYETLSDPRKRAIYDATLSESAVNSSQMSSSQPLADNELWENLKKIKAFASAKSPWLFTWWIVTVAIAPMLSAYARASHNPQLADEVYRLVSATFKNVSLSEPGLVYHGVDWVTRSDVIFSPMCEAMATVEGTRVPASAWSATRLLNNPVFLHDATGQYGYSAQFYQYSLTQNTGFFDLFAVLGLTYATVRTYQLSRENQPIWSHSLSQQQKTERLLILLIVAGLVLVGLDALTNCFGMVTSLAEEWGVVPLAAARACRDGFSVRHTINDTQDVFFNHSEEQSLESPALELFSSRTTAAVANIIVPPAMVALARVRGLWHRVKDEKKSDDPRSSHRHSPV